MISTTTLLQVGREVTKLLELPLSTLERYRNNFVYIHSFNVSQRHVLQAFEKVTGTTEKDWQITKAQLTKLLHQGRRRLLRGI